MPNRESLAQRLKHLIHLEDMYAPRRFKLDLATSDVLEQLQGAKTSGLFLGRFTGAEVQRVLEEHGILDALVARGYDPQIHWTARDSYTHALELYAEQERSRLLLGQIVLREAKFRPKTELVASLGRRTLDLMYIEWLLMQDPRAEFTQRRPRLPGQEHPGLGLGHRVVDLLVKLAERMGKEGILNIPEFYHNGLIYMERFMFLSPRKQAEVRAIYRDLHTMGLSLADISHAACLSCLVDKHTGRYYTYKPEEIILPLADHLKRYFDSDHYQAAYREHLQRLRFDIDRELFHQRLAEDDSPQ